MGCICPYGYGDGPSASQYTAPPDQGRDTYSSIGDGHHASQWTSRPNNKTVTKNITHHSVSKCSSVNLSSTQKQNQRRKNSKKRKAYDTAKSIKIEKLENLININQEKLLNYNKQLEEMNQNLLNKKDKRTSNSKDLISLSNLNQERDYFQYLFDKYSKWKLQVEQSDFFNPISRIPRDRKRHNRSHPLFSSDRIITRSLTQRNSSTLANKLTLNNESSSVLSLCSNDSISSDNDTSDEEFNIFEHLMESTPNQKQKNNRTNKIANLSIPSNSSSYGTSAVYDSIDESSVINETNSHESSTINLKHQWVYDLQDLDCNQDQTSFSRNVLVVLKCKQLSKLATYNLESISSLSDNIFITHINSVIIIQRCISHQIYCLSGLHSSLHFSLGPFSSQKFIDLCNTKQVPVTQYSNSHGTYVSNELSVFNYIADDPNTIMKELQNKMIQVAYHIIPDLLNAICNKSLSNSNSRTKSPTISLGITDQKVHLHQRSSITRQVALNLISTWKKDLH